jgi:hypothetical protein
VISFHEDEEEDGYYGARFTVVKDRKKELSPGLLSAMLA